MKKSRKELKLEHKILKKKKLTGSLFIFEWYEDVVKELKENETILALTFTYKQRWKVVLTDGRILIRSTRFDKTKKSVDLNYKDIDIDSLKKDYKTIHFKIKNKKYSFEDIKNKTLLNILKTKIEESKGKKIESIDEKKNIETEKLDIKKPEVVTQKKEKIQNIEKINSLIKEIKKKGAWDILVKYVENYYYDIFKEFDKLKYIFKEKYGIEIDQNIFEGIVSISKLKDTIIDKKKLDEIDQIEKELLDGGRLISTDKDEIIKLKIKIKKWKEEGYEVSELEDIIRGIK